MLGLTSSHNSGKMSCKFARRPVIFITCIMLMYLNSLVPRPHPRGEGLVSLANSSRVESETSTGSDRKLSGSLEMSMHLLYMHLLGCYALTGLLCTYWVAMHLLGCYALTGLLCTYWVAMHLLGCYALTRLLCTY